MLRAASLEQSSKKGFDHRATKADSPAVCYVIYTTHPRNTRLFLTLADGSILSSSRLRAGISSSSQSLHSSSPVMSILTARYGRLAGMLHTAHTAQTRTSFFHNFLLLYRIIRRFSCKGYGAATKRTALGLHRIAIRQPETEHVDAHDAVTKDDMKLTSDLQV